MIITSGDSRPIPHHHTSDEMLQELVNMKR